MFLLQLREFSSPLNTDRIDSCYKTEGKLVKVLQMLQTNSVKMRANIGNVNSFHVLEQEGVVAAVKLTRNLFSVCFVLSFLTIHALLIYSE